MLSQTEAAIIRAALSYWVDEIVPGGIGVARPYLDLPLDRLPDREETIALQSRFRWERLLYIEAAPDTGRIVSDRVRPIRLARPEQLHRSFTVIDRD